MTLIKNGVWLTVIRLLAMAHGQLKTVIAGEEANPCRPKHDAISCGGIDTS
jgi:hypothetical protein